MREAEKDTRFTRVVRDTHWRIRAYIAGLGVPVSEVDDVAQETFLALYEGWSGIPSDVPIEQWLKGIARNQCFKSHRAKGRYAERLRELAEILEDVDVEDPVVTTGRAWREALKRCMAKLSAKQKKMVTLKYVAQERADAIAAAVGSTAGSVRVALFRIRTTLRDCVLNKWSEEAGAP
jgi:RNA polymerase sigma-70 factor (ECF subfamily)